jgi:hypothetical protein
MITNPRYFVMAAADGKPDPSRRSPTGRPTLVVEIRQFAGSKTLGARRQEDERTESATAAPMGGSLAKGGSAAIGGQRHVGGEATLHASRCSACTCSRSR